VNWSGNIIDDVVNQNSGDDEIHGNDEINVADGADSDFVDCGPGTDTVTYDGPSVTSLGDTVTGCENLNLQ
jgi:hypothetical protein